MGAIQDKLPGFAASTRIAPRSIPATKSACAQYLHSLAAQEPVSKLPSAAP
jgi:hypothetical protein